MPSSSDQPVDHEPSAFDSSQYYPGPTGYKPSTRARRKHELAGGKDGKIVSKDRDSRILPKEV